MSKRLLSLRHTLVLTLLFLAGLASVYASPRVMPQQQAAHFCKLFVSDGQGSTYTLSVYAARLVSALEVPASYHGYTQEQIFTSLIFFYEDWLRDPLLAEADYNHLMLAEEFHSGQTLRLFPHETDGKVIWYAPTDDIPEHIGSEHRRYMQEVFTRLNAEVQAGNWPTVDAYIDKMIEYQCQFGSSAPSASASPFPYVFFLVVLLLVLLLSMTTRFSKVRTSAV